jgi:hypothetical protein
MMLTEQELVCRARWSYEIGRVRRASKMLLVILPLLICAWMIGRPAALIAAIGTLVSLTALGGAFLNVQHEKAVLVGVTSALPALLLPWAMRNIGLVRISGAAIDPCIPGCVLAGGIAGAAVAIRASRERHHGSFWLVSTAVAAAVSVLGCSIAGGAGLIGLAFGVLSGTAPILVHLRERG